LEGINQLIGHGWPYSPDIAGEPGWRFYAAAVFNHHNPWWIVMPDITKYLQRVSFALRQGKPANDVAIYLATDDAWAHMERGQATINNYLARVLNPELVPQILDAGYNFDFIDDRAISSAGIPFKILVLPEVERIPIESYQKIVAFAAKGGIVIAEGHAPTLSDKGSAEHVGEISRGLFEAAGAKGHLVKDVNTLGKEMTSLVPPDFSVAQDQSAIGVVHRKLDFGDLYFVVNTSNHAVHTTASVRITGGQPQWWDPMSGTVYAVKGTPAAMTLQLAPYESRILVFAGEPVGNAPALPSHAAGNALDLASDWNVAPVGHMEKLHSWADDATTKFYSGAMNYRKTIEIPASFLQGHEVVLDFGEGTALPDPHRTGPGMRALLESPVHEAAVVTINGRKAGSVWHPPYQLDVTKFVHAGKNEITIEVGNLALNEMAGQSLPNYRLLNLRYGERFQAQDMDQVQPMPSGLTGGLKLVSR
jgi:hypothetical protein